MNLRPYQIDAVDATLAAWDENQAVLGVAATGLGKTILTASIIAAHPGRTMLVAHREELIFQAVDKIRQATGIEAEIEMADLRALESSFVPKARGVVSTIQTQVAGRNGGRMTRFRPADFDLLVIDEAHHATASTYRRVIEHYRTNPTLRVLGVTATPDRADEQALGQIFDAVAFDYDLRFGIDDGWLVPIVQRSVHVDGLDLSAVRTTAGDLNGADLARVMEYERNLHEVAAPTIDLTADGRKTLIFASSLAHAERLCEILNRHKQHSARWVHGKTPKDERRQLFADYAARKFQYLVNVGVATEGFDDPGIEAVVMARPTKRRALYTQMVGRGTRPLPGVVDDPDHFGSATLRREAIAASPKTAVEVLDFVGNSGRPRLINTTDILAGNYSDEIVERARQNIERDGPQDTRRALTEAEKQVREERERDRQVEAARRAAIVAKATFTTSTGDPFAVFGLQPWRERGWHKGRMPTPKMRDMLDRAGIDTAHLTFTQASQLIEEIKARWDSGKCSYKQARLLAARGKPTDVSREQARLWIDEIATREGWKRKPQASQPAATTAAGRY